MRTFHNTVLAASLCAVTFGGLAVCVPETQPRAVQVAATTQVVMASPLPQEIGGCSQLDCTPAKQPEECSIPGHPIRRAILWPFRVIGKTIRWIVS